MKVILYLFTVLGCHAAYGQLQFSSAEIINVDDRPENFTGYVIDHYSDGSPKLWREEKNGKADGLWQEWYPDGILRYRAWWKNGLGNGKWEYFYPNGKLSSESFYIDDMAQGLYMSYHENGQIAMQSVYLNGELEGFVFEYDINGIPKSRRRYQNGIQIIDEPVLFQPGIISTENANEWDITFTPDNETAFFTRRLTDGTSQKIYETKLGDNGVWSEPVIASFSTDRDEGGFISPDGKYFFFGSCRSKGTKSPENDLDMNIWMMTKTKSAWSQPQLLPNVINKDRMAGDDWPKNYETGPTIDSDGNFYFWTKSTTQRSSNLYKSVMKSDGSFTPPLELIPPSHNEGFDSAPVISPDGNLLFFASSNRSESYGGGDLYFSKLIDGAWSEPKNLGPVVNSNHNDSSPRFSPDGKFFFFTSDRAENFDRDGERIWSIYYMEAKFLTVE